MRYFIAPGKEPHSWILTSTSKQARQSKMYFENDDVLMEFLLGVMVRGGHIVVEIPHSASEKPEYTRDEAGATE